MLSTCVCSYEEAKTDGNSLTSVNFLEILELLLLSIPISFLSKWWEIMWLVPGDRNALE